MRYQILGEDLQVVEVELQEGEKLYSEAGAMFWMTSNVNMRATTGGKGFLDGLIKVAKRAISGESLALVEYTIRGSSGKVVLAAPWAGKIIPYEISSSKSLILQKGAYLAHVGELDISITFTKRLTSGFFGGEGFILQKLSGEGLVFFFAGGYIQTVELQAGESISVDTGCLVGFEDTVDYSVEMLKDIGTWFFGGEGALLAKLTGPGKVWLQSMPISNFALRLIPFLRRTLK